MNNFDFLECNITTLKPKDFDEVWMKWKEEVHNVKNHIDIIDNIKHRMVKRFHFIMIQ